MREGALDERLGIGLERDRLENVLDEPVDRAAGEPLDRAGRDGAAIAQGGERGVERERADRRGRRGLALGRYGSLPLGGGRRVVRGPGDVGERAPPRRRAQPRKDSLDVVEEERRLLGPALLAADA